MIVRNISTFSRGLAIYLLYFSTLYGFTNHILLLVIPVVIFNLNKLKITPKSQVSFIIIIVISFLSVANNVWFTVSTGDIPNLPYMPLIILSFLFAQFFNEKAMKFLLCLIIIEIMFAFFEYMLGVSSIFKNNPNYIRFSHEALYYRKVAGLSDSSSVLSYKVLIGLFVIHFIRLNSMHKKLLYSIMLAGVLFSFNRTVVVSSLLFLVFVNMEYIKEYGRKPLILFTFIFIAILASIYLLPIASDYLLTQLSRGDASKGVDLSSRSYIWFEYWQLIKESPLFGSGSYKVFVTIPISGYEGHPFHAHNSILMLLATQGIFISILYFVLIAINITKNNIIYIISIFIYSMAQYGVFWGTSFLDVMLFYFLFNEQFHIKMKRNKQPHFSEQVVASMEVKANHKVLN